ncbi:MAG: nucleotidyltransferase family protein [Gammaproteobacteria bacterium]|nr:nucleotidyltransferase family protein [Gammaproteobacteria bacterium]
MKAMILAAGRGERLRPLTDTTPKPLLEVRGKPLIVHHLEALARGGFEEVVVNLNWLGKQIRNRLGDGSALNLTIEYSVEADALETAGGIVQALPLLGERFVVINADIFTNYDFARLRQTESKAHLVLVENPSHHPQGDFTLTQSTIGTGDSARYTFSGISMFRRRFFDGLKPGKQALAPLLYAAAAAEQVTGELFQGKWTDIGTVERLRSLND